MSTLTIGTDGADVGGVTVLPGARFTFTPNNMTVQDSGRVLAAEPWALVCDSSGIGVTVLPDDLSLFGVEIRSNVPGWATRATDFARYFQGWNADATLTLGELLTDYQVVRPLTADASPPATAALLEQIRNLAFDGGTP